MGDETRREEHMNPSKGEPDRSSGTQGNREREDRGGQAVPEKEPARDADRGRSETGKS